MQRSEALLVNPLHMIVWAGIEEVIKDARLSGLIALGRAVAGALPGDSVEAKLESFEGGLANREVLAHEHISGRLVRLKHDLFASDCCGLPWSQQTASLIERYNAEVPRGGAASHPLHIVLHEVHRGLGQIVDLATRDPISGAVITSRYGLQRTGLSEAEVTTLLGEGSILYCICG
jgi:hypothetical protein